MEQLMACRICLATDVKLFDMYRYGLESAYENLTGLTMSNTSSLQHVCSYCGTLLNKFKQFRAQCERSQCLMQYLLEKHVLVTTCNIKSLNLLSYKLPHQYKTYVLHNFDIEPVTIKDERENTDSNTENNEFNTDNFELNTNLNNLKTINTECNKCYLEIGEQSINDKVNEQTELFTNEDNFDNKYDSDEEPLAKKVKKKQRKCKKSKILPINEEIPNVDDIKIENVDDFVTNDESYPNNDAENDKAYPVNDKTDQEIDNNLEILEDMIANHDFTILSLEEQKQELLERKNSSNYKNSFYKCEKCFKGFQGEATYQNHMGRHDPVTGESVCVVCFTHWPDAKALKAHIINSHERRYTCKLCGEISKSTFKAKEHFKWHSGVTYSCSKCEKVFNKKTSYLTHIRLKHSTIMCDICNMSFIGQRGIEMHKKKAHRNGKASKHKCAQCKVVFGSSEALARHAQATSGYCDNTMHVCTQCGDHYASDALLKEHRETREKTGVPTCPQCPPLLVRARTPARPSSRADTTYTRVCELCGQRCRSATSLAHHQRIHSGEKPFACTYCQKRFTIAQRLQIHIRTHTGERPYQCARCPKAFKNKAALNRHDRVHTGVKPYECPQCGKRFAQSNTMKQHCSGVHKKHYLYSRGRNKDKFVE